MIRNRAASTEMSALADQLKEQFARSQQNLIDFLRVDLELAFTILSTAKIEKEAGNLEHMRASLKTAREALSSIRKFAGRVQDRTALSKINARTKELEAALSSFER